MSIAAKLKILSKHKGECPSCFHKRLLHPCYRVSAPFRPVYHCLECIDNYDLIRYSDEAVKKSTETGVTEEDKSNKSPQAAPKVEPFVWWTVFLSPYVTMEGHGSPLVVYVKAQDADAACVLAHAHCACMSSEMYLPHGSQPSPFFAATYEATISLVARGKIIGEKVKNRAFSGKYSFNTYQSPQEADPSAVRRLADYEAQYAKEQYAINHPNEGDGEHANEVDEEEPWEKLL